MKEVKKILIDRDEMSEQEADEYIDECMSEIYEMIEEGDYLEVEDAFADMFGLEPDYLLDMLL